MPQVSTALRKQVNDYVKGLLQQGPRSLNFVRALVDNQFDSDADAIQAFKDLVAEALTKAETSVAEGLRIDGAPDLLLRWQSRVINATKARVREFVVTLLGQHEGNRLGYVATERAIRRHFSDSPDEAIRHFVRLIFDPTSPIQNDLTDVILVP